MIMKNKRTRAILLASVFALTMAQQAPAQAANRWSCGLWASVTSIFETFHVNGGYDVVDLLNYCMEL